MCVCCHNQASNGPGAWVWSHRMARRRHHHHDPSQNRTSTIDPIPPARLFLPTHRPRGTGRGEGNRRTEMGAVRVFFLSDTHHHHQPLITATTITTTTHHRTHCISLARCCPCRPCLALHFSPLAPSCPTILWTVPSCAASATRVPPVLSRLCSLT